MAQTQLKWSIKKNDMVQVMVGREKGKTGKVMKVDQESGRVTIEKVNMVKRHIKANQQNPQGGVVEKELAIAYSNVLLHCSKCNRGVRHGVEIKKAGKDGAKKTRTCKRCKTALDAA
ncbi:MAG: 50S ribosomal protein L24 [Pseudobdellovibrionaceae bacterium]